MFKQWKGLGCLALAVVILAGGSAEAQRPGKRGEGDTIARLEAELALLKKMTAEVEAKLKAAKDAPGREADKRGPFGKGGFGPFGKGGPGPGRFDPEKMKEKMKERMKGKFGERFDPEKLKEKMKEKFGERGGPRGKGKGKGPEKGPQKEGKSDVERRLERLMKEIDELRKQLKR